MASCTKPTVTPVSIVHEKDPSDEDKSNAFIMEYTGEIRYVKEKCVTDELQMAAIKRNPVALFSAQ
jgi:hypothetical protein